MPLLHKTLMNHALADAGQVLLEWDFSTNNITFYGDAAPVLGIEPENIPQTAQQFKNLVNPQDLPDFLSALQAHSVSDMPPSGVRVNEPLRMRARDGTQRHLRLEGRLMINPETQSPVLGGILRQSSPASENAPEETGVLTGRRSIATRLEEVLLSRSAATRKRGFFLSIGLDRVGLLNEAYGAPCVDTVLHEVERRLTAAFEKKGEVGRISGDVYGIILPDLPHNQVDSTVAGLMQNFTATPVLTLYGPVMIGLSVGGVALSDRDEQGSDIIARAEAAMLDAKERGRGSFVLSTPHNSERDYARKLLAGGQAVYKALEEGRMRMAFQPVMNMDTGQITFFESLIRMIDNHGRLVAADEFFPALEELGMTRLLDVFALHCVVRELERFPDISLSVNVSNQSLVDASWLRSAIGLLSGKPHIARRLIVEITESSVMHDLDHATRVVGTLKELGCKIALDDFGAGQTSFRQLKILSVDIVKIDKSYIRDIQDPINQLFVKSLLELAAGLNLMTVAEGAETKEEAEMLHKNGISNIQGYAFGFPSIERVWLPKTHKLREQKTATA